MSINSDEIVKEVLRKYSSAISHVYAKQITSGVKRYLLSMEDRLLEESAKALFQTMLRQVIHSVLLAVNKAVEETLTENADIIADQVRRIVISELNRMREKIKEEILESVSEKPVSKEFESKSDIESKLLQLSNELRECKMRLAEVNSKLGTFFNLMLQFEPRFHVIPILEESGQIKIDRLAAMLRTPIHRMVEFLRILEGAGIVRIHGDIVKLSYPIFKSSVSKSKK